MRPRARLSLSPRRNLTILGLAGRGALSGRSAVFLRVLAATLLHLGGVRHHPTPPHLATLELGGRRGRSGKPWGSVPGKRLVVGDEILRLQRFVIVLILQPDRRLASDLEMQERSAHVLGDRALDREVRGSFRRL